MHFIDMSDYNRGVRAYWWATTMGGAAAVAWALVSVAGMKRADLLAVMTLMALVFLVGFRPTRIPSTHSSITPGDIFIFLTAIFFGASAATLVAVTDAFCASCRTTRRWTSRLGGPALMAIAAFISASAFEGGLDWLRHSNLFGSATFLTGLLLFSLAYFLLNSVLAAIHQSLKGRTSLIKLWWTNYVWASLTYAASASAAGLIYLAIIQYGVASLIAAVPLVGVIFATCHFYFKQADERAKASDNVSRMHLATVEALATAINAKDEITHDHVYRVRVYACGLARHFGLSEPEIEALKAGALLHDVGKIAVPDYILNKPGKLTAAEFEKMKIHTVVGAQIMERVNFPYPVVPIVRHHHERWDGRGYPDGLSAQHIPLTARILTVADCFDAVRENRQYHKAMSRDEACRYLRDNAGSQFDPSIVAAFLANLSVYEAEIVAHKASQEPLLSPTTQAGLSESAHIAVPAAGLAPSAPEEPDYLKQIHASRAEVAALYEMAQTFSASLDVRDVLTLTVNRIEAMIPFTTCVVYLRDKTDDSSIAAHAFGENAGVIRGSRMAVGHGITGWVIINGVPMINTDPMLDLGSILGENEAGYRTAAVFPLTDAHETIGALALYSSELSSYGGEHLHLLESVSRLASTALQHAFLHERTKASAQTDPLTGLPNGRALYARLEEELVRAEQRSSPLTIICLNLVGLRSINDSYGYRVGDRMLSEVAARLDRALRDTLMLSRIAGDEFICLIAEGSARDAIALYERARLEVESLSLEVRPGHHARVRLSFGLARYPDEGQTIDELLHAAASAARQHNTSYGVLQESADPQPVQSSLQRAKTGTAALVQ